MKNKLSYFIEPEQSLSTAFSEADDGILCKQALVLVEGTHKDNKQRIHNFSRDRLFKIAQNSNALFERGTRIPLLTDHNKTQDAVVGDVNSSFVVKEITEENLPNAKHRHLIGRLGLFVDDILVKSRKAIEQAKEGLLSTISPGIDVLTDTIREISFTPTPAIVGLTMFNDSFMNNSNPNPTALSFDELEQDQDNLDDIKDEFEDICEKLWIITQNILTLPDETLQGLDMQQLVEEVSSQFLQRYTALLGMSEEQQQMDEYNDPRMMMNSPMYPGMGGVANRLQGTYPSPYGNRPGTAYSDGVELALFSMDGLEAVLSSMSEEELAEFGYRQAFKYLGKRLIDPSKYGTTRVDAAKKFGKKMLNATRGKINSAARLGGRIMGNRKDAAGNPLGRRLSTAKNTTAIKYAPTDPRASRSSLNLTPRQKEKQLAMEAKHGVYNRRRKRTQPLLPASRLSPL